MEAIPGKFKTVNEYFAALPVAQRKMLMIFRNIVKELVPAAEEVISYNIPAFRLNKILIWYAVHKTHIGFYPRANAIQVFKDELTAYKTSKGAIQFPFDQPIPVNLLKKIIKFRIKENMEEENIKGKKKKK